LSTLGSAIAVIAVVAMLAVAAGAKRETLEQIAQLGVRTIVIRPLVEGEARKHSLERRRSAGLQPSDAQLLRSSVPTLSHVAPMRKLSSDLNEVSADDGFEVLAVTPDYQAVRDLKLASGRFLAPLDQEHQKMVCVIGAGLAERLTQQGRLGKVLHLGDSAYTVVGILAERRFRPSRDSGIVMHDHNRVLFIPMSTEPDQQASFGSSNAVSEIVLQVERDASVPAAAEAARRTLELSHRGVEDYQIVIPEKLLRQTQRSQHVFNMVLACIASISALVGGIGIMNSMFASVLERSHEIGVRRSVGASQHDILRQFLVEAVLLSVVGGVLGAVLGVGAALIIGQMAGWPTVITLWSLVLALGLAAAVGVVSGLLPAVRAARLDPIEALRP
jgi:putative ABC transport system permease protein